MADVRRHVFIDGIVQGVAFRHYTKQTADRFSVNGWVRNLADGRVEAVFEGDEQDVDRVVQWCRQGPPSGRVDSIDVQEESPTGEFSDFRIAYGR